MSNIYIQEPPTSGKVILKTTVGDIDIELWCREAPKACRNFIQLCMEKYYDNTMFHRLVKGFIIQGGDPNGDGTGGESIYGEPFKDEFHSRLRFTRRGLVAMANSERNDNGSQFFFTLAETPELQNKNTIFAKVAGDTIYNMLKMEEGIIDENERPLYPHKIIKTEILLNPFDDIIPRQKPKRCQQIEDRKHKNSKEKQGIKNFGLLSFGEEAEEDEVETNTFVQTLSGKAKSTHDVLDDPKLSKETALTNVNIANDVESDLSDDDKPSTSLKSIIDKSISVTQLEEKKRMVHEKLNSKINKNKLVPLQKEIVKKSTDTDATSSSDTQDYLNEGHKLKRKLQVNDIREKIKNLKKEYQRDKKVKMELVNAAEQQKQNNEDGKKVKIENNVMFNEFVEEQKKYLHLKETIPKKSAKREQLTLELLTKFRNKLEKIKEEKSDEVSTSQTQSTKTKLDLDNDDDIKGDDWLSHTLRFGENESILAKDASTKQDDWYDVYDPRNPINKRKRGEGSRHQNKQFKQ